MKKLLIILLVLAGLGFLTYEMISLGRKECSLCLTFKEQRKCVSALGPTNHEALEEAHRNACALLAQGVTESLACGRTAPDETQCKQPE